MGVPRKNMRILDDKEMFYQYYKIMGAGGSANKIQKKLAKEGVINRALGKPITTSAIWQSINRYLARNYKDEEVKRLVIKYQIDCGLDPLTDEEYLEKVSRSARTTFNPLQYRNFIRNHPELPYYP